MINCNSLRAAVMLSASLLLLGVVLGVIAMSTPLAVPASHFALLLVLTSAVVLGGIFLLALLPKSARLLDGCQH